jgi:hypothetical protein
MINFGIVYPQINSPEALLLAFIDQQQTIEVPLKNNNYLKLWFQCSQAMMLDGFDGNREIMLKDQSFLLPPDVWNNLVFLFMDHQLTKLSGIQQKQLH